MSVVSPGLVGSSDTTRRKRHRIRFLPSGDNTTSGFRLRDSDIFVKFTHFREYFVNSPIHYQALPLFINAVICQALVTFINIFLFCQEGRAGESQQEADHKKIFCVALHKCKDTASQRVVSKVCDNHDLVSVCLVEVG